jgi:hypothetical protein
VPLGESVRGEVGLQGRRVDVVIDNGEMARAEGEGRSARVQLSAPIGQRTPLGELTVVLAGRARRFDAWLGETSQDVSASLSGSLDIDTQIELPATARQAISVGSYTSRLGWQRRDGGAVHREREELLGASFFTAAGPTADGRFAPDLAAPGEYIASALSREATPDRAGSVFHAPIDLEYLWADDGVHALLRGTSQAAPHVAGAVALMFQVDPSLRTGRLRELLRASAASEIGYSTRLGFGRLDVLSAIRLLRGEHSAAPCDRERSSAGLSRDLLPPHGGETVISVTPRDREGRTLGPGHDVRVEAMGGTFLGEVRDLGLGRYERTFFGALPQGTTLGFSVLVDGVELAQHPLLHFANRRSEIGEGNREQPSGCAVFGTEGPPPLFFLLALGLLRLRWRRR